MNMTIPFRLRGKNGTVTVEYGVNDDPLRWGYDLLNLAYPLSLVKGFPYCYASIAFEGEGYGALLGWIQLVEFGGTEEEVIVDVAPQLMGTGFPYTYWGHAPTFFDAPSTVASNHQGLIWTARTFLVASPDALMSRVVQPVCGFQWGYRLPDEQPELSSPMIIDARVWEPARSILQERYPTWEFLLEWANEL
ncbi:MAG TPA: hypothetical protein VFB12_07815 [Ktedonobacteraceae bacterium]|jgi:hypothetical protein|nr:hypothetical protein [Ktedonobacteraceae bacterium]